MLITQWASPHMHINPNRLTFAMKDDEKSANSQKNSNFPPEEFKESDQPKLIKSHSRENLTQTIQQNDKNEMNKQSFYKPTGPSSFREMDSETRNRYPTVTPSQDRINNS